MIVKTHSLIDSDIREVDENFPKVLPRMGCYRRPTGSHRVSQQARVGMRERWVLMPSTWSYELCGHTTAGKLAFRMGRRPEGGHTF